MMIMLSRLIALVCLRLSVISLLELSVNHRVVQAWTTVTTISIGNEIRSRTRLFLGVFQTRNGVPFVSSSLKAKSVKSGGATDTSDDGNEKDASSAAFKMISKLPIPEDVAPFKWKYAHADMDINPGEDDITFVNLLMNDFFIDKSAALHNLIKSRFSVDDDDFRSASLLLVYPRRFAKTTMLGFIEAVFSPAPLTDGKPFDKLKKKIASLEMGKELLEFGLHPVLRLDMQKAESLVGLHWHISDRLQKAGLDKSTVEAAITPDMPTALRVEAGANLLNEKFKAETGVTTKTILLIDEHDKPFRDKSKTTDDPLIKALISLYTLGKTMNDSPISLLILCGLTRMVGTGLSQLNNLVDVSLKTKYHGLCGVSAKEFIRCAAGQLDSYAKKKYKNQTFKEVLEKVFASKWNGFRFGLDNVEIVLDPNTPEGALFSPLDVWEIVRTLSTNLKEPSSKWMESMTAEFEFASVADKYLSSDDGFLDLLENLAGGWVDTRAKKFKNLKREDYMLLEDHTQVQKVLFELGLLSVKEIDGDMVLLREPNEMVLRSGVEVLIGKVKRGPTPEKQAKEYLSSKGFRKILSRAAKSVTNIYCGTGPTAIREFAVQDLLFKELLFYFPPTCSSYDVFKEASLVITEGRLDVAVGLYYPGGLSMALIIEVKLAKITTCDAGTIKGEHNTNINAADTQVRNYIWKNPRRAVKTVKRVAVSGVWHPETEGADVYKLSTKYKFLK